MRVHVMASTVKQSSTSKEQMQYVRAPYKIRAFWNEAFRLWLAMAEVTGEHIAATKLAQSTLLCSHSLPSAVAVVDPLTAIA